MIRDTIKIYSVPYTPEEICTVAKQNYCKLKDAILWGSVTPYAFLSDASIDHEKKLEPRKTCLGSALVPSYSHLPKANRIGVFIV
eukprot:7428108-Ditylum_brightwellii.AAC.1